MILGGGASHSGGNRVVESTGDRGAATDLLASHLNHTRGLLDVLDVASPVVLDGEHIVGLGDIDGVGGLPVVRVVHMAEHIAALTQSEVLEVSQLIHAVDGHRSQGQGVGGVDRSDGLGGIVLTPDGIVTVVETERDRQGAGLGGELTTDILLHLGDEIDGGRIACDVADDRALGHLVGAAVDLDEVSRENLGELEGHRLVERGVAVRGSHIRAVTDNAGGEGLGVGFVVVEHLMQGNHTGEDLPDEAAAEGDGGGVSRNLVADNRQSQVRSGGVLQAGNLLRVEGVGTGQETVGVPVGEKQFTSRGLLESDVEVGVDVRINSLCNIEVASLIGVEVLHNIMTF